MVQVVCPRFEDEAPVDQPVEPTGPQLSRTILVQRARGPHKAVYTVVRDGVSRVATVLEPELPAFGRADPQRSVATFEQRIDLGRGQPLRASVWRDHLRAGAKQPLVIGAEPVVPLAVGVAV